MLAWEASTLTHRSAGAVDAAVAGEEDADADADGVAPLLGVGTAWHWEAAAAPEASTAAAASSVPPQAAQAARLPMLRQAARTGNRAIRILSPWASGLVRGAPGRTRGPGPGPR